MEGMAVMGFIFGMVVIAVVIEKVMLKLKK